jgi:hypothetical protein
VKRGELWQNKTMKTPIYIRELTALELNQLNQGLRSKEAFTLRRCQILRNAGQSTRTLNCASQTVSNSIKAFNAKGLESLRDGSNRLKTVQPLIDAARGKQLKIMLSHSLRPFVPSLLRGNSLRLGGGNAQASSLYRI